MAKIKQTNEGQPDVGSFKSNVRITMTTIAIMAARKEKKPTNEAKASGNSEKATIPSKEYLNKLQKDHEVSPATRS